MCELLLRGGADPTLVARDGSTAMSIAKSHQRKVISLIIAEGGLMFSIVNNLPETMVEFIKVRGV